MDKLKEQVNQKRHPNETTVEEDSWKPDPNSAWGPPIVDGDDPETAAETQESPPPPSQPEAAAETQELVLPPCQLPPQSADNTIKQNLRNWKAQVRGETSGNHLQNRTELPKVVDDTQISSESTYSVLPVELEPRNMEALAKQVPKQDTFNSFDFTPLGPVHRALITRKAGCPANFRDFARQLFNVARHPNGPISRFLACGCRSLKTRRPLPLNSRTCPLLIAQSLIHPARRSKFTKVLSTLTLMKNAERELMLRQV